MPPLRRLAASRGGIVVVAALALLALDGCRSWAARALTDTPAEQWQPAPYASLAWPPGDGLPADTRLGERVFVERCAVCHGPRGEGNGPAAPSMIPRPRDLTRGEFKYKSTAAGQPPTDADLVAVVRDGLPASAMPYWGDVLGDDEIAAVVEHVKGLSGAHRGAAPTPLPSSAPPERAGAAARGRDIYSRQGCPACHGPNGRSMSTLSDARGYPVIARDLTAPWTFRGGAGIESVYLRLTTGMAPGPMPPYATALTDAERWDLARYVVSLARTPPWEPGGTLDGPGTREWADPVKRGEYVTHASMCGLCHTQVSEDMVYSGDDFYLAGGMGIPIYPHGVFVSRNLTPHATGLAALSPDEIATAMRTGHVRGQVLNLWAMPWMFLHGMSQDDAMAVGHYLRSRPPVPNHVPPVARYGAVETVVAKLSILGVPPIAAPEAMVYEAGNYGSTRPTLRSRGWAHTALVAAQVLVLVTATAAWVWRGRPWRSLRRGPWRTLAALAAVAALAACAWAIYQTPALKLLPAEQVHAGIDAAVPVPPTADTPAEQALLDRGRYLFMTASCAFCHGVDGAGGAKINAPAFGTLWVRNITPHASTGIGTWTDAEIARAMKSGVSRDGSALHWQGMPWDHFSNLDEEDVRAVIAYLRALPPVERSAPSPAPPGPDDCAAYTFFLEASTEPGCE